MSKEQEREYWIAGGADLEKALAFIKERNEQSEKFDVIAKKYGGSAVHNGHRMIGLVMDDVPDGWARKGHVNGKPFYFPKATSKERRIIAAEMNAARLKGASDFHARLCNEGGVLKEGDGLGMRLLYAVWEYVGDTLLLAIPIGSKFKPDGSTKLKMSEYWDMKEKADV